MDRRRLLLTAVWMLVSIVGGRAAAQPPAFEPPPITVPAGYLVELAAAPPLVKHPMMAGFDPRGRLYVAETDGQNLPREELEKQLPNFVRLLEDTDGDGRFDKSTIFADKLTYPMGALWHDGALFVASSGAIWRLEDTDDDGVADRRDKLVGQFGYTGNAADVHGCFLGPCGRIYWCQGRHGHEFRDAQGQVTSAGKAARIFSCWPDGSDVQIHCGGGMDNPVEVDFTSTGEMLGTVNILYRQRGDCLVHWMHGGVYPRHDQPQVVAEFRQTGELLEPVFDFGHVAVSGTTRYRGTHLGEQFRDNFFVTEFNTHKVKRVHVTPEGPTFRAEAEDFLVCSSIDFHPTDVLEDADGSLLVIDTGGWFRRGCPTSQIAKPNILGAIYRIRRTGARPIKDARGAGLPWDSGPAELARYLGIEHPAISERAVAELARYGDEAVEVIAGASREGPLRWHLNAVWTLGRIGSPRALSVLRQRLASPQPALRQAAAYTAGIHRDRQAVAALCELLRDESPAVRREAATALGKIGDPSAVTPLLESVRGNVHRVLEHALIYALIEIHDADATAAALAHADPRLRRAALIALDQMPGEVLTREMVAPLLNTDDLALQQAALEVIGRHPSWGEEVVETVAGLLAQAELSAPQRAMLSGTLLAFSGEEAMQTQIAAALASDRTAPATRGLLLEVMARADLEPLPQSWRDPLAGALQSADPRLVEQAVKTVGAVADGGFEQPLLAIVGDGDRAVDLRVAALGVITGRGVPLDQDHFQLLAAQLNEATPPLRRLAAARAIGAARLDEPQLSAAINLVARAGPLELSALLGAFEQEDAANVGAALLEALDRSPGLRSLSSSRVAALAEKYAVQAEARALLKKLDPTDGQQAQRLQDLERQMAGGDPEAGKQIFRNRRTACLTCHQVSGEGGQVGPDLSAIGQRRGNRDLLEAILYPSSSLARGYESFSIVTHGGKLYSGLVTRETADALLLRTTDQAEVRIARDEIDEMQPAGVSVMPAGLDQTMTVEQLRDLVAYLRSLRSAN